MADVHAFAKIYRWTKEDTLKLTAQEREFLIESIEKDQRQEKASMPRTPNKPRKR